MKGLKTLERLHASFTELGAIKYFIFLGQAVPFQSYPLCYFYRGVVFLTTEPTRNFRLYENTKSRKSIGVNCLDLCSSYSKKIAIQAFEKPGWLEYWRCFRKAARQAIYSDLFRQHLNTHSRLLCFPSAAIDVKRVALTYGFPAGRANKYPSFSLVLLNAVENRKGLSTAIAPFLPHPPTHFYVTNDALGRAKIIRPAEVCRALVTIT